MSSAAAAPAAGTAAAAPAAAATAAKPGVLLGIGNPLLDISADVGEDILAKYEVKLNSAILASEKHLPVYEELVTKFQPQYIAGGATQNTIRVAQWLLPAGSTTYIGSIGTDTFGEQLRKSAAADGVLTHYSEDAKTPTGSCAVLINKKERSLIANLAAANNYKTTHLLRPDTIAHWLRADIIYSAGFFLTVSPESALILAKHCYAAGKVYATNLSAPFICEFFSDPLLAVVPYADYIFGNESEAKALGAKLAIADTSIAGIATAVAARPKEGGRPRTVVFTQGADPAIVAIAGTSGVRTFPVPALAAEAIVDVNGPGDAFVGGFLASLAKGKSLADCVNAGHYTASVILGVSGCVLHGKPAAAWL
jgi:adenosine kinase